MNTANFREYAIEPHAPHWIARFAYPFLSCLYFLAQGSLVTAVYFGNYWLALALAVVFSHLMHGMLIGLHEASHGLLRKNRTFNEIEGVVIGAFSITSFSLYRAAHQLHHAYLASERDEELWPFVHPGVSRGRRVLAAVLELTMGLAFTPFLFLRVFLRTGSPIRSKKVRRRIWLELGFMVLLWSGILIATTYFHVWQYLLWAYVLPAWLAGNAQSLRKYVEHVGLTGSTVNGSTRSVVAQGWLANFLSVTLLHEPYHGIHHWRAGIPHSDLPLHIEALEPQALEELPPYESYGAAFRDLFLSLSDPRVGAQWKGIVKPTRQELVRQQAVN
jgi:fatty acid desaturase